MAKKDSPNTPIKNEGSYALDNANKKVCITTASGEASVLFEDIASISYSKIKGQDKWVVLNKTGAIVTASVAAFSFLLGVVTEQATFYYITGAAAFAFGIFCRPMPHFWDDVSVETKGGKTIIYSVDEGQGKMQMEAIENAKRNL